MPIYPPSMKSKSFIARFGTLIYRCFQASPSWRNTQEDHGDPVNNEDLRFVFQGVTKDGRYYIDARFAIAHPSLPKGVADTNNIARDDGNQYLRKAEKDLEALPDESFKPSIADLNRLLASIAIVAGSAPVTSR